MPFDPDEYIAQKQVKNLNMDFDPDEYLASKESTKDVEPTHFGIPETTIEGALNALPIAGAVGGGALGGAAGGLPTLGLGAGPGAMLGAGGGAFAGKALANAIRAGLNMKSRPKTTEEIWADPVKEGLMGAAGEGAGQLISKVPAGYRAAKGFLKNTTPVDEILGTVDDITPTFKDIGFEAKPKPTAGDIAASTQRLGGKATPGMISSNKNIQNLESVLSQSPTIAGEKVRSAYDPIYKGLRESSEQLAGTPTLSPFEAGEQFKQGLIGKIGEKTKPLSEQFERIRESSRFIQPKPEALNRAADRLIKQDLAEFANLPQGQAISKYSEMIRNAKSIDSIKQLRTSVDDEIGNALNSGNGTLAMALGKVKSSLQRLERRSILSSAIENMPTRAQGEEAAKSLITDIKSVNKGWRSLMGELEEVASAGGIKKIGSPKHLARIIEDMPSEQISQRFFNTKNFKGLTDIKTHLPDEFEILRQNKLGEIAGKSLTKGEADPVKLVKNVQALGKEARALLFGADGERILTDMKNVLNAMPAKVGSSDTPRGISWFKQVLKPSHWGEEAESAYNYMLLQGKRVPTRGGLLKTVEKGLLNSQLPRAVGYAGAYGLVNGQNEAPPNE